MFYGSDCGVSASDKAHLFNRYFFSVFTRDSSVPSTTASSDIEILDNISISPEEVYEVLVSLDPNKVQGIDCLSPKLWKVCAPCISKPLCHLFTKCLLNSALPSEWLIHCITPIYKSGSRELVTNYRPISLLCIVSKVLERLVYNKVMPFLFNTFSVHQFGFLPKRCTTQQLLLVLNIILKAIYSNKGVDILYLDFRKAFDWSLMASY